MTKNGLCPPSSILTFRFLEGRPVAGSAVSLPHPAAYFAESRYLVSVAYWGCPWKAVCRMADGSAFCVCVMRERASVLTRLGQGRGGTLRLQQSHCASLPKHTQVTNSLP